MKGEARRAPLPCAREATCCFTGHRSIPLHEFGRLRGRVDEKLRELYARGIRNFRCGGALGFDTMAATAVVSLRREHPDVRLVLILPCLDQAARWSPRDVEVYEAIKKAADEVVYTSLEYTRDCMFVRNRALVDGSGVCVSYMNTSSGGTGYTVRYAASRGVPVENLGSCIVYGTGQIHI